MRRAIILLAMLATAIRAVAADGDVAGFDDRRGAVLPDNVFIDENAMPARMSQFFSKPFYLAFAYHTCPQLCGLVLGRFAAALRDVPGRAGDAFDVVVVSIDPDDSPQRSRAAKQRYVSRYGGGGEGWHFLTGEAAQIHALAQAAGFRYLFDPIRKTFVHPAGVFYIDRGGIVRGHVEGTDFTGASLIAARDASPPASAWSRLCGALGVGNGVHSATVLELLRASVVAILIAIGAWFGWRMGKGGAAR